MRVFYLTVATVLMIFFAFDAMSQRLENMRLKEYARNVEIDSALSCVSKRKSK